MVTQSDYPDFLRVEQWVGSPFERGVHVGVVNGQAFGPYYVAPWEALAVDVSQAAGVGGWFTVTVDFYDAPGGNIVSTVLYLASNGQRITDVVPVHSLYAVVTIALLAGPRDMNITLVPRRGFDPSTRMFNGMPLMAVINQPIAASPATAAVLLNPVMAAHCTFTVSTNAAVWSCVLYETSVTGVEVAPIGSVGSAAGRGTGTVTVDLPPTPVVAVFANGDAAGRTWEASVVPQRI